MNRPLTIKEWFESLGKMVEEFDWEGNGMSEQDKTLLMARDCYEQGMRPVADELRRLHHENKELKAALKSAPVEQTICLNPIHNETICSQNQDFYTHKQKQEIRARKSK